jgi:O-antigen/teichoic acid export membrane protein
VSQLLTRERLRPALAHPVVRQNVIYFVGSFLALVLAFLYQFVAGRLLGPERYSTVAAIFALYFVLLVPGLMVTTVAMRQVAVFKASGRLSELGEFFRRATVRLFILSAAGGIVLAILAAPLSGFLHVPLAALFALVPATALLLPAALNKGVLQGEQRFLWASWIPSLEALTRMGLVATVVATSLGATGAILALSTGVIVAYAASLFPLRHLLRDGARKNGRVRTETPAFIGPTMVAVIGVTLLYTADVLLVKHFLPSRESGLYGSVVTLGRIVFMVTTSITTVMFAQVAAGAGKRASGVRILGGSAIVIAAIGAAIVLVFTLAPGIVLFPFGSAFSEAAPYLPFFGAAMTMLSLANLLINYLVAIHDARFVPVILLADLAQIALITTFHQSLWTIISIVFGVSTASLLGLLAVVVMGRRTRHVIDRLTH